MSYIARQKCHHEMGSLSALKISQSHELTGRSARRPHFIYLLHHWFISYSFLHQCNFTLHRPITVDDYLFKKNWRTSVLVGSLIPLFGLLVFQSKGGSLACLLPSLHAMASSSSALVWHLLTSSISPCKYTLQISN